MESLSVEGRTNKSKHELKSLFESRSEGEKETGACFSQQQHWPEMERRIELEAEKEG